MEEVYHHLAEEGRLFDEAGKWQADLEVRELDVPEGVRLAIGRRLERVSAECRKTLTTAAVIGPKFELDVLADVEESDVDSLLDVLEEAEGAKLIHGDASPQGTLYKFAHELIRQTLVATLSVPRRQRKHVKIAEALDSRLGVDVDANVSDLDMLPLLTWRSRMLIRYSTF